VYIAAKLTNKCVRVHSGDRMGVYFEEGPGAVAYTFNGINPMALAHQRPNRTVPAEIGEIVEFDGLTFPYDFSMAAYIDTSKYLCVYTVRNLVTVLDWTKKA